MNSNPWQVDSIEAFCCLKCPECDFNSRNKTNFKAHAVVYHPRSIVFFGTTTESSWDDCVAEPRDQPDCENQNSLSEQEQQPQHQSQPQPQPQSQSPIKMTGNGFQYIDHSDQQKEQSNHHENDHSKPFNAPYIHHGSIQQQLHSKSMSQNDSFMPGFDSKYSQATLSQNRSVMPSFDSNNTQATHKGQKEAPKLPKEDPRAPFMRFESNLEKSELPKHPKLFNCEICSASFKYQKSFKNHMEKKHQKRIKMSKDPKLFNCKICGASYNYFLCLKTHMEKHKENHSNENNLQENFPPAVPANTVSKGILDTKMTQDSNLEVQNGSGIMPNSIPQTIQNDNISPLLQEIAHNPGSGIMPSIPQYS